MYLPILHKKLELKDHTKSELQRHYKELHMKEGLTMHLSKFLLLGSPAWPYACRRLFLKYPIWVVEILVFSFEVVAHCTTHKIIKPICTFDALCPRQLGCPSFLKPSRRLVTKFFFRLRLDRLQHVRVYIFRQQFVLIANITTNSINDRAIANRCNQVYDAFQNNMRTQVYNTDCYWNT